MIFRAYCGFSNPKPSTSMTLLYDEIVVSFTPESRKQHDAVSVEMPSGASEWCTADF